MRISLIGAGNLATRLGIALKAAGHEFVQVYSRTESSAEALAHLLGAEPVVHPEAVYPDTTLYICALKDDVLPDVLSKMEVGNGILVHTAGSLSLEVLQPFAKKNGVFYPLQTFSKDREVDFKSIPLFLETSNEEVRDILGQLAVNLGSEAHEITSEQRLHLHLSAVFACNFVNYLYTISSDLLAEQNLPFEVLKPLILETAAKVQNNAPANVQTGPAVRFDRTVINKHLALLEKYPVLKSLYKELSMDIHQRSNPIQS
ncbi:MAG TPA: Rossmann-like and DUF2520 domain-containing protein [Bacteroidales bacterium]|nr:Rossmann-like and DUF2520 domain-containing protein [Bacteroidales bacterium]